MGKSPKISNWVYPKTRDTTSFEREHDKPLDLRMHCFQTRPHHDEAFLVYIYTNKYIYIYILYTHVFNMGLKSL